jgi:hypothetical protein
MGKPIRKQPFEGLRIWENTTIMNIKKTSFEDGSWMEQWQQIKLHS